MYSKQEASQLRQEFWTSFGQYLTPVLSAEGEKINWINYKTGEKGISFRMQAGNKKAIISIDITQGDEGIRQLYFEQFLQLKNIFANSVKEEWVWLPNMQDENNRTISRIYKELSQVSIYNKSDWPAIISFFKPRIIALDEFWNTVKYSFEALR